MKNHFAKLTKIALASATLALCGCTTALVISGAGETTSEKNVDKEAGYDKVLAFAQVKANSKTLPADSLVMMGEQYWYVLNQGDSAKFAKILTAPLSQRFGILSKEENSPKDHLNVYVEEDSKFSVGNFCLVYHLPNIAKRSQEESTLQKLHFYSDDAQTYQNCFSYVNGTFYRKPQGIQPDHRFEQSISIKLFERSTKTQIHFHSLLAKAIAVPMAVTLDVVTLPLQILVISNLSFKYH